MQRLIVLAMGLSLAACSTTKLQVAVDPATVPDAVKFDADKDQCQRLALEYDLSGRKLAVGTTTAVAAGGAAAGVATIVAGAVFLPALPFIVGAAAVGGATGGGLTEMKERQAREKIYAECLRGRGYTAYTGN